MSQSEGILIGGSGGMAVAAAIKVAKAAATAGQRDVSFVTRLGFPALIAVICLLGIGVVFYAWTTREALATPSQADHWHAVYGVYDCNSGTGGWRFQAIWSR